MVSGRALESLEANGPVSLCAILKELALKDTNYHFSWLKKYFWILDIFWRMIKLLISDTFITNQPTIYTLEAKSWSANAFWVVCSLCIYHDHDQHIVHYHTTNTQRSLVRIHMQFLEDYSSLLQMYNWCRVKVLTATT